jgi:hypothetical protein
MIKLCSNTAKEKIMRQPLTALGLVLLSGAGLLIAKVPYRSILLVEDVSAVQLLIKPQRGEAKWMEIRWEIDVQEARKKAAAQGKPIFFLTAGGLSPLGDC